MAHRNAVLTALQYCRIYGLNWKSHILPKKDNGRLVGFYVPRFNIHNHGGDRDDINFFIH